MQQRLIASKIILAYTSAMPRNNPIQHTPDSINVYCQMLESQLTRLRYCAEVMRASKLSGVVTQHDDSFHTGLKKVQTFVTATEKATTQRLANPQLSVQESLMATARAASPEQSSQRKKASAKKKSKD